MTSLTHYAEVCGCKMVQKRGIVAEASGRGLTGFIQRVWTQARWSIVCNSMGESSLVTGLTVLGAVSKKFPNEKTDQSIP